MEESKIIGKRKIGESYMDLLSPEDEQYVIGEIGGYIILDTPDGLCIQGLSRINVYDVVDNNVQMFWRKGVALPWLKGTFEIEDETLYYHVGVILEDEEGERILSAFNFDNKELQLNMFKLIYDYFNNIFDSMEEG